MTSVPTNDNTTERFVKLWCCSTPVLWKLDCLPFCDCRVLQSGLPYSGALVTVVSKIDCLGFYD